MGSRVRRGNASGPAEWLLVFLQARDNPPRARIGTAAGPTEWLLVFLGGAAADATNLLWPYGEVDAAGDDAPSLADELMARFGGETQ
jgi:hypothetical protein